MIKKIVLKKKTVAPMEAPTVLHYIPAIEMEDGVQYVNPLCNVVLTLKEVRPYEGVLKGIDALRETTVVCTGISANGDTGIQVTMLGTQPVLCDQPALVEKILKQNQGLIKHISTTRATAAASRPQKTDAEGKPVEKKTRGSVDPRTGCSQGSQGHVLGTIMLDNKCSPSTREKCIMLMTEKLHKEFGFEEKKAKGLASSWYSTLYIRKPHIYKKDWK